MHVDDLDEWLCSPPRLAIMLSLASRDSLSFTALKAETGISDGNLHMQAKKLLEAKYIQVKKSGSGRGSRTLFRISPEGRRRLDVHIARQKDEVRPIDDPASGQPNSAGGTFRVW